MKKKDYTPLPLDTEKKILGVFTGDQSFYKIFFPLLFVVTLQQLAAGIGMGIVVLASQYWGQQKIDSIKKIITIGVKFAFIVGVIFFVVAKAFPTEVLSIFTNDQKVIAEGEKYLNTERYYCRWRFHKIWGVNG